MTQQIQHSRPNEVLGNIFKFLPTESIPIVSTCSPNVPPIFLLYAVPDGAKRLDALISSKGRGQTRPSPGCYVNSDYLDIYQVKDIELIIKSNLIAKHHILRYLAKRGLLALIQKHWNAFVFSRRKSMLMVGISAGSRSKLSIFYQLWTFGILSAANNGHLEALKWMWVQWNELISAKKNKKEILCYMVGKAQLIVSSDIRRKTRNKKAGIGCIMGYLHLDLMWKAREHPQIVKWILSLNKIKSSLANIFEAVCRRPHSPRTKTRIESAKLILEHMKTSDFSILELLITSITRVLYDPVPPDVEMFKFLLNQKGDYGSNALIDDRVMGRIINMDLENILAELLKDPHFDLSIYENLYHRTIINWSCKVLNLILKDGRLNPVEFLIGATHAGAIVPLRPLRYLYRSVDTKEKIDIINVLRQDPRLKPYLTDENMKLQYKIWSDNE